MMDMKEKREIVGEVADLLEYQIRSGKVAYEDGDRIFRFALKHPEKVSAIVNILDMELPSEEAVLRVERL